MKHFLLYFALTLCAFSPQLSAQTTDSMLIISPGLSPAVVSHGRFEVAFFNQLSTEKVRTAFDTISDISRFSSLYHVLQAGYGVARNNRLNVGASLIFAHNRYDSDESRSPLAVLGGDEAGSTGFHKMAAVGFYARGIPFRKLPELTVQAGVFFPATNDLNARQFSGYDRTLTQLQFSFYQQLAPVFYLFATAETNVLFSNKNRKQTSVGLPVNLYPVFRLGYYSDTYLFGNLSYNGFFNKVEPGFLKSTGYRLQYGLGAQHYFSKDFSAYLLLQFPAAIGTKSTTTTTLKKGVFTLALGARCVI